MKQFARRLPAGSDLLAGVTDMVEHYNIAAGAVLSASGVLSQVSIELADHQLLQTDGQYIIKSLTGTAALDQVSMQLDLTTSTGELVHGNVLEGCLVAEGVDLVLGAIESSAH